MLLLEVGGSCLALWVIAAGLYLYMMRASRYVQGDVELRAPLMAKYVVVTSCGMTVPTAMCADFDSAVVFGWTARSSIAWMLRYGMSSVSFVRAIVPMEGRRGILC